MDENFELLMHIYKTSEMGVYTTTKLIDILKNKENKIKPTLELEIKEYENYLKLSKKLLVKNDITPKGSGIMAKMGSNMGIMKETIVDNSDPALAGMIIEGMTMGIVELSTKVKQYDKIADKKIIKLAKKFIEFQEKEIEKLKTFM